jgi:hypothetical protein
MQYAKIFEDRRSLIFQKSAGSGRSTSSGANKAKAALFALRSSRLCARLKLHGCSFNLEFESGALSQQSALTSGVNAPGKYSQRESLPRDARGRAPAASGKQSQV